jgi:hypothetical protein
VTVADPELVRSAQSYADLFNQIEPGAVSRAIDEAAVDRYWDDRTNLFLLNANDPTDVALVLSAEPDTEDYLVVRWVGEWVVDDTPVDWESLEADAFDDDIFDRDAFDDDAF